jgi:tetratricopeptide (TPR) repeat protein
MSERFAYMPSVGYALALAVLLYRLALRRAPGGELNSFRQLYPALGLAAALVLLYGLRTVARNPAWQDNYTLFSTDVAVSVNSAKLQNAMGGELIAQATLPENEPQREAMLRRAADHLQRAVSIHPNYKNAHLLLGNAYYYLERWEEAISSYQRALQLDPGYEEAAGNLAITYRDAGRHYGEQQGDLGRALQYLQQAYQLEPNDYETARLLGVAYGIQGNAGRALEYFTKAVELDPDNPDALYNLGSAYYNAGNSEQGRAYHQRAAELDPDVERRMRSGGE